MELSLEKERWLTESYPIVFRRVYNTLRRNGVRSAQAAECAADGTQHATLKFLEKETEIWPFPSFQQSVAWMFIVAIRYVWADIWRKNVLSIDSLHLNVLATEGDNPLSCAVRDALVLDLSEEDRTLLKLKYELKLTDVAIATILIQPDDRTSAARGQELRLKRLKAESRLASSLAARGFREFLLDVPVEGQYNSVSINPSD
jgi:hypothetical protein